MFVIVWDLILGFSGQIELMRLLAYGGTTTDGGFSAFGMDFFKDKIDFGKGLLDPDLKIDELVSATNKANYILGKTNINPSAPGSLRPYKSDADITGNVGGSGSSVINSGNTTSSSTVNNQGAILGGTPVIDLNDQMLLN